jgi:uncharacterized protein (TIGR02001 family)
MKKRPRLLLLPIASLTLWIAPASVIAESETYASLTLASDYLFRGVSQTLSGAALQGEIGIEHSAGWYGYAWASNVDFTDGLPEDGASLELNFGAGRSFSVTERVSAVVGMTAYLFPDTRPGFQYDYLEWHATLAVYDAYSLTVGYSDDVFGSGRNGYYYEIGASTEIASGLAAGLNGGYYDLEDAYEASYGFGEIFFGGSWRMLGWQVSYVNTFGEESALFPESTIGERVVLELQLSY